MAGKLDSRVNAAAAKEALSYDPATGAFTWRSGARAGRTAGALSVKGYTIIQFGGVHVPAHRLAFLFGHGRWPNGHVDHIDGDRANNRLANLRECSMRENKQNISVIASNTTGYPGVARKGRKFSAQIRVNGVLHHLGAFTTPEAAYRAYRDAKLKLHPFAPHGRNLPATPSQPEAAA